jgi:anti-sigma B factor antagonist
MNVSCEDYDKVAVVGVDGELSDDTLEVFRATVERNLLNGRADFVVNFEKVASIDSAGLEALLWLKDECRQRGGDLKLAALDETASQILVMTRLDRQFDVHQDVVQAVKGFAT